LEYQMKNNGDLAKSHFFTASQTAAHLYEPFFNAGKNLKMVYYFSDLFFLFVFDLFF